MTRVSILYPNTANKRGQVLCYIVIPVLFLEKKQTLGSPSSAEHLKGH
jgi:hypothetical protein